MAETSVAEQWRDVLLNHYEAAMPRVRLLAKYWNGEPNVPGLEHAHEGWKDLIDLNRTPVARLVVEDKTDRIKPQSFTVVGDADATAESTDARDMWTKSRMDSSYRNFLNELQAYGASHLSVNTVEGETFIRHEKIEQVYVISDPYLPWKTKAAMKVVDGGDDFDYLTVYVGGTGGNWMYSFRRRSWANYSSFLKRSELKRWEDIKRGWEFQSEHAFTTAIPIYKATWNEEQGIYETATDLIDKYHYQNLELSYISRNTAFPQTAILGDLDDEDEDGNAVDITKMLKRDPGELWQLGRDAEGNAAEIWQSQAYDFRPQLQAIHQTLATFAAMMKTPVTTVIPDGQNQAAEAARLTREGSVAVARSIITAASPVFEDVLSEAINISGASGRRVRMTFEPLFETSEADRWEAAALAAEKVGMSKRYIITEILGHPGSVADEEEAREKEAQAKADAEAKKAAKAELAAQQAAALLVPDEEKKPVVETETVKPV
jgi:hypothetical protein